MPDVDTPAPAPEFVIEEAGEKFAPRTRKSTSESLTALKPNLEHVKANPDRVFTIVKGLTPEKSASLVSLLNGHYPNAYTFGARSTPDGDAIVQAKYSTTDLRPVRTVNRKPVSEADKATAAAKRRQRAAAKR
jgi:hypothetical protein